MLRAHTCDSGLPGTHPRSRNHTCKHSSFQTCKTFQNENIERIYSNEQSDRLVLICFLPEILSQTLILKWWTN